MVLKTYFSILFRKYLQILAFIFVGILGLYSGELYAQCDITGPTIVCTNSIEEYELDYTLQTGEYVQWELSAGQILELSNEEITIQFGDHTMITLLANVMDSDHDLVTSCQILLMPIQNPPPQIKTNLISLDIGAGSDGHVRYFTCFGSTEDFWIVPKNGATYEWTVWGPGQIIQESNSMITVNFNGEGGVTICVKETDLNGCTSTNCISITVYQDSEISFEVLSFEEQEDIEICQYQELFFVNSSDPRLSTFNLLWEVYYDDELVYSFGNSNSLKYTFTELGNYRITLNYGGFGSECFEMASRDVTVVAGELIQITCISFGCFEESSTYEIIGECTDVVWSVTGGTIISENNSTIIVLWDEIGSSGYGLIEVSGDCGDGQTCISKHFVPIFPETVAINGNKDFCSAITSVEIYTVPLWPGATYTASIDILQSSSGTVSIQGNSGSTNSPRLSFNQFIGSVKLTITVFNSITQCSTEGELIITSNDFEFDPLNFCHGDDVEITVSPSNIIESIQWMLQSSNNIIGSGMSNDNIIEIPSTLFPRSASYTLIGTIFYSGMEQCIFSKPLAIQELIPVLNGPSEVCENSNATYSTFVPIGTEAIWMISGGTEESRTTNTITIDWDGTIGPYYVGVKIKNTSTDCESDYNIKPIRILKNQPLTIIGPEVVCPDFLATYMLDTESATNISWSLNSPLGSIIGSNNTNKVSILWHVGPGNPVVELTVTYTVCGSSNVSVIEVSIENPEIVIYAPETICAGTAEYFFTNIETGEFLWEIEDKTYDVPMPMHTFKNKGLIPVKVTIKNPDGCPGTYTQIRFVKVLKIETNRIFGVGGIACPSEVINMDLIYVIEETNNYTYQWYKNGIALTGETGPILAINANGMYSLIIEDGYCVTEVFYEVDLNCGSPICECPSPYTDVEIDDLYLTLDCGEYRVEGRIEPIDWQNLDPPIPYWIFPNENGFGYYGDLIDEEIDLIKIKNVNAPGYYWVQLVAPYLCNEVECLDTDQQLLRIPMKADFDYEITCDTEGDYEVSLINVSKKLPDVSLVSEIFTVNGGSPLSVLTFSATPNTQYTVFLEIEDGDGVICTETKIIDIPGTTTIDLATNNPATVCEGSLIEFEALISGAELVEWLWDFDDGSFSRLPTPFKLYGATGFYEVKLTGINIFGCQVEQTLNIEVIENELDAGTPDITYLDCSASAELSYEHPGGNSGLDFFWSPGNYPSTDEIIVYMNTMYTLVVSDDKGCQRTYIYEVENIDEPFGIDEFPDSEVCQNGSFNFTIIPNTNFTYNWEVRDDQNSVVFTKVNSPNLNQSHISPALSPGIYNIKVIALFSTEECASIDFYLTLIANPAAPIIDDELESCDPQLIELTVTNYADDIFWFGPGLNQYGEELNPLLTGSGGTFIAKITDDITGCFATSSIAIPRPIDFTLFFHGCYTLAECELDLDIFELYGIPGNFVSWRWEHTPIGETEPDILSSGSGQVPKLVLSADMEGDIRLFVDNGYCSGLSQAFCLEVEECETCPEEDVRVVQHLAHMFICGIGESCTSGVYEVHATIIIPPGWEFCEYLPTVKTNGHLDIFEYGPHPNPLLPSFWVYRGWLYIDDLAQFTLDDGIFASIILCNAENSELECEFNFKIRGGVMSMCMEELNPRPTTCLITEDETVIGVRICPAYFFIDCDECEITEYYVTLRNGSTIVYTDVVEESDLPLNNDLRVCFDYIFSGSGTPNLSIEITNDCSLSYNNSIKINNNHYCPEPPTKPYSDLLPNYLSEKDDLIMTEDLTFGVVPNPSPGNWDFIWKSDLSFNTQIFVINWLGNVVDHRTPKSLGLGERISFYDYISGIYTIVVVQDDQVIKTSRIIITN